MAPGGEKRKEAAFSTEGKGLFSNLEAIFCPSENFEEGADRSSTPAFQCMLAASRWAFRNTN